MDDTAQPTSGSKPPLTSRDAIYLRNLRLSANVEPDAWGRSGKSQPVVINLQLHLDTSRSGISDSLQNSFSYGQMCKDVISAVDGRTCDFNSLGIQLFMVASRWPGGSVDCKFTLPKMLLLVEEGLSFRFQIVRRAEEVPRFSNVEWSIKGLKASCIIGVNAHERLEKQTVIVELHFFDRGEHELFDLQQPNPWGWRSLVTEVNKVHNHSSILCRSPADRANLQVIENSAFETLEALAALIAKASFINTPLPWVEVMVEKPSALTHVEASGVRISRSRESFILVDDP